MDETTIQLADGALEGAEFVTFNSPTEDFKSRFTKEYGKEPRVSADTAYDSVYLIKEAIERVGSTDVVSVQKELESIRKWEGASGLLTFDEYGGRVKKVQFKKVVSGKIE